MDSPENYISCGYFIRYSSSLDIQNPEHLPFTQVFLANTEYTHCQNALQVPHSHTLPSFWNFYHHPSRGAH